MTINPRVVRALRDARTRLRDVAAAEHTVAATGRDAAAQQLADEHHRLESFLDDARTTLAGARNVHDLDRLADFVDSHHAAIADASRSHAEATALSELTAGKLRDRTRQLRTAERLVDMSDRYRADRDAKAEQRSTDDLGGRRR